MKYFFKKTKVVYDHHMKEYQVMYKNWLCWRQDSVYKFDSPGGYTIHYRTKDQAEEAAILRASNMLEIAEIWKSK